MRAVLLSMLIALAVSACGDKTPDTPPVPEGVVADLSTLSFLDFQGNPVSLATYKTGRPVVVNFWATWCAPCREEMPVFAEAQRRHPEVRFLMVNQGENAAIVQRYLARENLALQDVFLDPASALGPAVGSRGLPTTLFLDAQGRRVHAHMGALNAAALATQVRRLQAASN